MRGSTGERVSVYAHVWAGEYWREGDWQALDTHTNDTSFLDLALQVCVCVCVCVCVRARARGVRVRVRVRASMETRL